MVRQTMNHCGEAQCHGLPCRTALHAKEKRDRALTSASCLLNWQTRHPGHDGLGKTTKGSCLLNSKGGTLSHAGPTWDRFLHCAGDADCAMASSRCHSRLQQVQRGAFSLGRCLGGGPSCDDCLQSPCQLMSWGSAWDN